MADVLRIARSRDQFLSLVADALNEMTRMLCDAGKRHCPGTWTLARMGERVDRR